MLILKEDHCDNQYKWQELYHNKIIVYNTHNIYWIFSDVASIIRIKTNNVDSGSETNNS